MPAAKTTTPPIPPEAAALWKPTEQELRAAGLMPAERMMTGGIWQNVVRGKPGPLFLVLLPPDVAVGAQYDPPLWKGPLRNLDELIRCVRHYGAQLTPPKEPTA